MAKRKKNRIPHIQYGGSSCRVSNAFVRAVRKRMSVIRKYLRQYPHLRGDSPTSRIAEK